MLGILAGLSWLPLAQSLSKAAIKVLAKGTIITRLISKLPHVGS